MRELVSFSLFVILMVVVAAALFIVARNELEIKQKASGGYGMVAIFGLMLVFLVMPVFAYFVRF